MAQSRGTEGAPRHAKHAASGTPRTEVAPATTTPSAARRHAAHSADAPRQPRISQHPRTNDTGYVPQTVPVATSSEQDAPRPIGVDPTATGSFQRISAGQGATMETRDNVEEIVDHTSSWHAIPSDERRLQGSNRPAVKSRQTRTRGNRKLFIGITVAVVVIVVAALLATGSLLGPKGSTGGSGQPTTEQTDSAGTVTASGTTYALRQQSDGKYALVSWPEGSASDDPTVYFEFDGSPVQLILYQDTIIIPENTDSGWDVIAYTMGIGSVGTQVVDEQGNPVQGQGQIQSAQLVGTTLTVTDSTGASTEVNVG